MKIKCVFCRLHIVGSYFFNPFSQTLLIGVFRPFTLKVIIDIVGLISTLFVKEPSIHCTYSLLPFKNILHSFLLSSLTLMSILYDFIFSLLLAYQFFFWKKNYGWLGVCNIHLQLIYVHFQITLFHFIDSAGTLNRVFPIPPSCSL